MIRHIRTRIALTSVVFLFLVGQFSQSSVLAQEAVAFSEPQVENNFPDSMIFRVDVSSNIGEIVSAKFVSSSDNYYSSTSYSKETVEMEAGKNVTLEYVMETEDITAIPMMPITYYWDVVNAQGTHYQSETRTVRYEDTRFNWKVKQSDQVGVWWHDKPDSFGDTVFDIASKAVQQQPGLFKTELDYQIIILIYNNGSEFSEWQGVAHEWVGGQTFSNFGITAQIVEGTRNQQWLNAVIPHEISHLYFQQATHNPKVSVAYWLNEGVAQYNEFTTNEYALRQVRSAAENGKIISLSSLENGFGAFNEERVYLAYDEALSAVTYLVEMYGEEGLSTLLKAYKQGNSTDDAFRSALGIGAREFEVDWAAWAGFPGEYAPPTPRSLPTFIPSPTMFVPGSDPPAPATATVSSAATITEPVNAEKTSVTPTPAEDESPDAARNIPCLSCFPAMGLGIGVLLQKRYRKKTAAG